VGFLISNSEVPRYTGQDNFRAKANSEAQMNRQTNAAGMGVAVRLAETSAGQLYFFYEGFGTLLAPIARLNKLTLKPDGLFYKTKAGTYLVSDDSATILRVLGYEIGRFELGFSTREELFEYVMSSTLADERAFYPAASDYYEYNQARKVGLYRGFEEWLSPRCPLWHSWRPPVQPDRKGYQVPMCPQPLLWAGPDFFERFQQGLTEQKRLSKDERQSRQDAALAAEAQLQAWKSENLFGKLNKDRVAAVTGRNRGSTLVVIEWMRDEYFATTRPGEVKPYSEQSNSFSSRYPAEWNKEWVDHVNAMADDQLDTWIRQAERRMLDERKRKRAEAAAKA
jgi:hypothetical protein